MTAIGKIVKKEATFLFITYIIMLLIFTISFYKSSFLIAFKTSLALFYIYLLPGYIILTLYSELDNIEKLFFGAIIGYISLTLSTYLLNVLFFVSIKSSLFLPIVIIIFATIIKILLKKFKE